jgi:hypothetical protein
MYSKYVRLANGVMRKCLFIAGVRGVCVLICSLGADEIVLGAAYTALLLIFVGTDSAGSG